VLEKNVTGHRLPLLTEIPHLLLTTIPQEHGRTLRAQGVLYRAATNWTTG